MNAWTAATAIAAFLFLQDRSLVVRVVPPLLPLQATAGGEVLLEVVAGSSGEVASLTILRDTPPFTAALTQAVAQWRFRPKATPALPADKVLVAAMFRAPTLLDVAPPPSPPADLRASPEVPVPVRWERPPYPPNAVGSGVVILEVGVGKDGSVSWVRILQSTPPFAAAAVDAARKWRFRPARDGTDPVAAAAYLVFAFREPVTPPVPGIRR